MSAGSQTFEPAAGFPVLVASSVQNQNNAAPTTLSFTPPATANSYLVFIFADVSVATAIALKLKITYKDPAGTAQTDVVVFDVENSATLVLSHTTADRANGEWFFSVDNSGTAITVADNTGTYTTCTYRLTIALFRVL